MLKTSIKIEVEPFFVPDWVQSNMISLPIPITMVKNAPVYNFKLEHLSPETLERLCDDFREEVFNKAGKRPPPKKMAQEV